MKTGLGIAFFLIAAGVAFLSLMPDKALSLYGYLTKSLGEEVSVSREEELQIQAVVEAVPDTGVPLSTYVEATSTRYRLEQVGVSVETFVITKEMVACAGEVLGTTRLLALRAGESPTATEITLLLPCQLR
jgi:hypothetical protein